MLENETKNEIVSQEQLNNDIDKSLSDLPLAKTEQNIVTSIIEAPSKEVLQEQFELFNINQVKKNALRIIKLNDLLTKVEDQAIERFEKRPDQVSNKEIIEYMNVISNQIERAQNFNRDTLSADVGGINIRNQKNEININVAPTLDKEGKEHVIDAISALLKQVQQVRNDNIISENEQIIEAEIVETGKENNISNKNIVYTNEDNILNDESEE